MATTTSVAKDYYTVAQVAKQLDVSPALVRRWIADGDLPACRTAAGRLHIDKQAADAILTPKQPPRRHLTLEEARVLVRTPLPPLTAEERSHGRIHFDVLMEHRKHRPSIAPLTSADLVHMGRRPKYDLSFNPD